MHATQAESQRLQNQRVDYWRNIRDINPEDLIFIDETGLSLAMTRTYARSLKGARAYGARPDPRGESITLIGAMALNGLLAAMTVDGGTNQDVFQVFIKQILVPCLWPGATVVMDNLPAHKVKTVQTTLEAAGARVIYLSAYSPDFNPIENCWSKLKEYLRSMAARTRDSLEQAIANAINLVTPKDIRNWFAHCCYCTSLN
ncbi:MAG: IS630 family transposase [Chroococcidiopsidaceae cyanobacterium CP_BM_ER_R8_30]|nr:IS630 family transposase [Chroococcidiopsidaceae cyanobacterium CP_BM_ER_R8_30]